MITRVNLPVAQLQVVMGIPLTPCAAFVGAVETHLAADQGQRVWFDGAIVGAVEAHLAADQGHWVWLGSAVVGTIEAHLAAVAAVAEDVGRCGRVWLGLQRP